MEIETHPFQPWLPHDSTLLMLGTFPPSEKRWCMPWYYPNYTNDMWRIFGVVFFNDPNHFVDQPRRTYKLQELKQFLLEKRIAIFDTALRIERTTCASSSRLILTIYSSKFPNARLFSLRANWQLKLLPIITIFRLKT